MDQSSNMDIKWVWKVYATPASRLCSPRRISASFDQFCFLCFCSGLSLEDFYLVTELSRYNLGVACFKTLISRSYLINFPKTGGSVVARARCVLFSVKIDL